VITAALDGTVGEAALPALLTSPIHNREAQLVSRNSTQARRPVTVRMARWSATHPWPAIGLWLVFVVASIAVGSVSGTRQMSDLDDGVGQSGQAARVIHDAKLEAPDTEDVLVSSRSGSLDMAAASRAASQIHQRMATLPGVASVAAPVTSHDHRAVVVTITLRPKTESVDGLLAATSGVQRANPSLRVEQVGDISMNDAVNSQVGKDLGAAATFSLPVTLLILLVAFGAIVAAGVPVLLALSAVGSATGLSALASHVIHDSGSTSSMILLMGMAVGVDYSLFYVKRAREERHRGRSHLDAIEVAAETSGHSVLVSGAAVIVSMVGLFFARHPVFNSLALGSIIVVAVAVIGSLTVLPALLVKLGRLVDRPRVPFLWRIATQTREPRLWPAVLRPALNRPGRTLVVSVVLLGALALPALGLKLQSDTARSLPTSIPQTQTLNRLTQEFPSRNTSNVVVVKAPAAESKTVVAQLDALQRSADRLPVFSRSDGGATLRSSADGTVHVVTVDTPYDAESAQAHQALTDLRERLVPQAVAKVAGAQWWVGGETADSVDTDARLSHGMPWVIGFVVLLTMLIMGWVFRSVVIAVTTALVNLLSVGAAFGVLVLVFQHTWAEGLMGFRSTGAVVNWIPLFTFAVLFGLSMDYHVFVLSRIREAVAGGMSTRDAVRDGITRSAGTVTSAAIVMVSVFAIFASLHMVEMKELGLSLAVAVLVDALVIRVVVLPALMTVLGRWNWWPGRIPGRTAEPARTSEAAPAGPGGDRSLVGSPR
jgi:RND superfamily putative drug exporter